MQQSAQITKVLQSPEFKAYMPKEPRQAVLKATTNLTIGFLLAAGIAGVYMLVFQAGTSSFNNWLPTLFSLLGGIFTIYALAFGLGSSRRFVFDDKEFEVLAAGLQPIRCPWQEVVSVKRIWFKGFEIITRRGRTKVWWWMLAVWDDGYSKFIYHVLQSMAIGYDKGKLQNYKIPVELEAGSTYKYDIPPDIPGMVSIGLAFVALAVAILETKYGSSKKDAIAVAGLFYSVHSFYRFWQRYAPMEYRTGDRVVVTDTEIEVTSKGKSERVPFELIGLELFPGYKARPFKMAETYGIHDRSIKLDRRFLVKNF